MTAPPFKPLGLDHLLLHVRGMAEAERFYCGVLGCEVKHRISRLAMIELSADAVLVDTDDPNGAWALEGAERGRNLDHFALLIDFAHQANAPEWLERHGVTIEEERSEDEERSLYVRDPSGNLVELICRGAQSSARR